MIPETLTSLSLAWPGGGERRVRVWVPQSEVGETFPVIYMPDGQNLFDPESSGFGCWHTREAVRDLRRETGRAAVVVGIHTTDPDRTPDLTPGSIGPLAVPEELLEGRVPQGEIFDRFLTETVMPAVEARFPVKPGRAHTALCGSSSGGLEVFFNGLSHPEKFSAVGAFSPAFLLYAPQDLIRWIRTRAGETEPSPDHPRGLTTGTGAPGTSSCRPAEELEPVPDHLRRLPRLHLFCGAAEPLERDILEGLEAVLPTLWALWPMEDLRFTLSPRARHHETAWEPEFRAFLRDFLTIR